MRLRTRREFQRVSAQGQRVSAGALSGEVLKFLPGSSTEGARLGITVSKKYGKAHDRNLFKRRVREAFRLLRTQILAPIDINVRPRLSARQASFKEIQNDLEALLRPFILPPQST